jgi:hypothetical protein
MSLVQSVFRGPYRCWKCRSLFNIAIENGRVLFFEPLSEEEFKRWQEEREAAERQMDV